MKIKIWVIFFLLVVTNAYGQDYSFSFIENYKDQKRLKLIGDSLKVPLLISNNKIYVIGSSCTSRLLHGDLNGRNDDGGANERANDGNANPRFKAGDHENRGKSGGVGDREKKGKSLNRRKGSDENDRDNDGDVDTRNLDGGISLGTRCSVARNGKILLYTRQKIDARQSNVFFNDRLFNSKYFKIIQL